MKNLDNLTQQIYSLLRKACALFVSVILGLSPGLPVVVAAFSTLAPSGTSGVASAESFPASAALKIAAVNPGYDGEEKSNVGEEIMLINTAFSDVPELALNGFSLHYNGTGSEDVTLFTFPEKSLMNGEKMTLKYETSEVQGVVDLPYSAKKLGITKGELWLEYGKEPVDRVCWGFTGCYDRFYTTDQKVLWRNLNVLTEDSQEEETEGMIAWKAGEVWREITLEKAAKMGGFVGGSYAAPKMGEEETDPEELEEEKVSKCRGMEFTEVFSYFSESRDETFVELYNNSSEIVELEGCLIRYKKKVYTLAGTVAPGEFYVRAAEEMSLTKNPTSENVIELLDANDEVIDTLFYPHGQKKGASYANFSASGEDWRVTYMPTPGADNIYQEFQTCPEGKVINPETGNCVKESSAEEVEEKTCPEGKYLNPETGRCKKVEEKTAAKTCPEGKYLNPETNRCKKIETATTKTCPAGKYLNPETGRCKKYETGTTLKACKEGYERNPETNRCRKIRKNTGAAYALEPEETEEETTFIAGGAVISLVAGGVGYTVFQFRKDLLKPFKKLIERRGK